MRSFGPCKTAGCGKSLRAFSTKYDWETIIWPRIELGYGNNLNDWVIRSRVSKSVKLGYDADSEIAKWLVHNEGLSNLSGPKVRSKLPQKCGRRRWAGVALNYGLYINYLLLVCLIQNSAEKYYAVSNQAMLTGTSF